MLSITKWSYLIGLNKMGEEINISYDSLLQRISSREAKPCRESKVS